MTSIIKIKNVPNLDFDIIEESIKKTKPKTLSSTNIASNDSIEEMDLSNLENSKSNDNYNINYSYKDDFSPLKEHSIYSDDNYIHFQLGGDQGELEYNEIFLKDHEVINIIEKYFPDDYITEEDLQLLFSRMNDVGCGYIATCNTIFDYAKELSGQEFEQIFGFAPYTTRKDEQGEKYLDYNYEYMFLNYFLYYAKEKEGFESIEDLYGNEKDNPEFGDGALSSDDNFELIGMDGTYEWEVAEITKKFLSEKGIKIDVYGSGYGEESGKKGTWLNPNSKTYEKDKNYLEKYGFEVDDSKEKGKVIPSLKAIDNALKDGKKIIISGEDFPMYYAGNKDTIADDLDNVGPHSMSVVGVEEDKIMVSSWGKKYAINVKDIESFALYDYNK